MEDTGLEMPLGCVVRSQFPERRLGSVCHPISVYQSQTSACFHVIRDQLGGILD